MSVTALVSLATVALVLDAVDGKVARRTGTANPLGARFDGEVDAFLILLLSIAVSQRYGGWVLIIGAARYLLLLAGLLVPALAAPLPPRYWGKFVAAVQGIVLTVAISGLLDRLVGMIAVAVALLLLVESFGHDIIWLCRTGPARAAAVLRGAVGAVSALHRLGRPRRSRSDPATCTSAAFVRVPLEALVLIASALVLPGRPRQILAAIAGRTVRPDHRHQDPRHGLL